MSKTKHTPWEVGPTGHIVYASEVQAGERTPFRPRREVARFMLADEARLGAAAPDLLEAARAEEKAAKHPASCDDCDPHASYCEEGIRLFEHADDLRTAAIAKAEGK